MTRHPKILTGLVLLLVLAGCSAPKKVTYFQDAESIPAEVLSQSQNIPDPVIGPGDLLNINVSGVNMTAMAPFNKGIYIDDDGKIQRTNSYMNPYSDSGYEISTEYYLVNADGNIDFPIIGRLHVGGLTKDELAQKICDEIYPKYVKEKPAVDIRLMNFRVTVAGAVRNPGLYQSKNERMTFLEAIARAGDLDIKGERENILIYRTDADGTRHVARVNIHDKDFLLSPYYNLQQNDVIYVEPNKSMRQSVWQMNPAIASTVTIVGGMSSLASLVIGIINLSK